MDLKKTIKEKIYSNERIDKEEALSLFEWDLIELGDASDFCRYTRYEEESDSVGFIIDRIINYTNICEASCKFCAYHAKAGSIEPYELDIDTILKKIEELIQIGGTQVMLQGGLHPEYNIEKYINLITQIKNTFPQIYLHSFSPAEIVHISRKSNLSIYNVVSQLKSAGLNSIPGASDLLVHRIRKMICPNKISKDEWCEVMYALHKNDMKSTATMTYGFGETLYERVEHLNIIRNIQDETGIIRAFIPWSFSPKNTLFNHILPSTGFDYLRIVAIARIYLDNIKYIHAGWLTEGLKLAQLALSMGANDMGGVLMEESVVKATGVKTTTNMSELINIIENCNKKPVLRDSEYNIVKVF